MSPVTPSDRTQSGIPDALPLPTSLPPWNFPSPATTLVPLTTSHRVSSFLSPISPELPPPMRLSVFFGNVPIRVAPPIPSGKRPASIAMMDSDKLMTGPAPGRASTSMNDRLKNFKMFFDPMRPSVDVIESLNFKNDADTYAGAVTEKGAFDEYKAQSVEQDIQAHGSLTSQQQKLTALVYEADPEKDFIKYIDDDESEAQDVETLASAIWNEPNSQMKDVINLETIKSKNVDSEDQMFKKFDSQEDNIVHVAKNTEKHPLDPTNSVFEPIIDVPQRDKDVAAVPLASSMAQPLKIIPVSVGVMHDGQQITPESVDVAQVGVRAAATFFQRKAEDQKKPAVFKPFARLH